MLRRLATLALSLSLATTAFTATADARGFAAAPGAPRPVESGPGESRPDELRPPDTGIVALPRPTPHVTAAARARLRTILARRRAKNVGAFAAYARRGVYPHNFITNGELNVWRDADGHLCAAATMIFRSGYKQLVRDTAKTNNYVRLADVTDGALYDWILTSGLTHAEVIAIQVPMIGGPDNRPLRPEQPPEDWRIVEDRRLRARYAEVLTMLAAERPASLEAAIDALAFRPDLVAKLLR